MPPITFTIGEDCPLPGGEANGVGNERPETPFTKCGIALQLPCYGSPAINARMSRSTSA